MIPATLFRIAAACTLAAAALPASAQTAVPVPQPRPGHLAMPTPLSAAPVSIAPVSVAPVPAAPVSAPVAAMPPMPTPQPMPMAPPPAAPVEIAEPAPPAPEPVGDFAATPILPETLAPAETTPAESAATAPAAPDSGTTSPETGTATAPAAPLDLTQPENLPLPSADPLTAPGAVLAAANPVDTPDERQTLAKVNSYFNDISTLVGNFVQIGPDGSRADGKFFLQKPGKVRFYYQQPSTTDIIADGKSLVVRDRRLNTQDVYPLSQTPLKFLLERNLNLARDSKVVGVYEEPGLVSVAIEEETTFGGKARVLIVFASEDNVNYELKQWTITDAQGLDTTIAVSQLDTASDPDDKLFAVDYTRDIKRR